MQFSECGCDICIYFCKWSSPTLHSENRQFQYIWNSQYTVKKETGNLRGIFGFGANPFLPLKGIISPYVTSRTLDSIMYEQPLPNLISVHQGAVIFTFFHILRYNHPSLHSKPFFTKLRTCDLYTASNKFKICIQVCVFVSCVNFKSRKSSPPTL